MKPAEEHKTGSGAPVHMTPGGNVQLAYTGVVAALQQEQDQPLTDEMLKERLKHANTTTFLENTACIFAALQARTPLLLEGEEHVSCHSWLSINLLISSNAYADWPKGRRGSPCLLSFNLVLLRGAYTIHPGCHERF